MTWNPVDKRKDADSLLLVYYPYPRDVPVEESYPANSLPVIMITAQTLERSTLPIKRTKFKSLSV